MLGKLKGAFLDAKEPEVIGKGSFGTVYKETRSGLVCAVKKIESKDDRLRRLAMTEVSTMALLRHDNIVNFQGCHFETNTICIVMDYADAGTFSGFIQSEAERDFHSEYFGEEQIMKTIADCGNALNYLHTVQCTA